MKKFRQGHRGKRLFVWMLVLGGLLLVFGASLRGAGLLLQKRVDATPAELALLFTPQGSGDTEAAQAEADSAAAAKETLLADAAGLLRPALWYALATLAINAYWAVFVSAGMLLLGGGIARGIVFNTRR